MTEKSRNEYLKVMRERYQQTEDRKAKGQLLDEMVKNTGMNRDYLSHKLQQPIERKRRVRERGKTYGAEVDAALAKIAKVQSGICTERLAGYLLETAENLAQHGQLHLDQHLRQQLAEISVSTIRRHLTPQHQVTRRIPPPAVPNSLQRQIPIRRIPWNVSAPGHLEVDLVHHGGPEPKGQFGYTLQVIDVATGWSVRRALLGRSYYVVADAMYTIFEQLPFLVKQLHVDNGSEFLNNLLITFLQQFYPHIELLRSQPRHPNDNRFVEQKNDTLVRAYTGDLCLNTITQIRYLNTVYEKLGRYYNLWQPVFHQIDKCFVPATDSSPAHTRRKHDCPIPPLERLIATQVLPTERVAALRAQQQGIDLWTFHEELQANLRHLYAYPINTSDQPENVFETLAHPELFPAAFVAMDVIQVPALLPFPSFSAQVLT